MTQEQKAKAYDEALERAKKWFNPEEPDSWTCIVESIFPELKESEDEKIRKGLIDFVKSRIAGFPECKRFTDWLEKQGTPVKLSEEEQNRFAKGVLSSCALSFIDYLDAHKYESKMCVSNGECEDIENAFHNAMWDRLHRYYCKYIEKQCEQKEYTFKSIPRLLDMIKPSDRAKAYCQKLMDSLQKEGYSTDAKIVGESLKIMNGEDVPIAIMDEKQSEQKPTNKVEPKFKVGQWITIKE